MLTLLPETGDCCSFKIKNRRQREPNKKSYTGRNLFRYLDSCLFIPLLSTIWRFFLLMNKNHQVAFLLLTASICYTILCSISPKYRITMCRCVGRRYYPYTVSGLNLRLLTDTVAPLKIKKWVNFDRKLGLEEAERALEKAKHMISRLFSFSLWCLLIHVQCVLPMGRLHS